jgi:hypothetical protein
MWLLWWGLWAKPWPPCTDRLSSDRGSGFALPFGHNLPHARCEHPSAGKARAARTASGIITCHGSTHTVHRPGRGRPRSARGRGLLINYGQGRNGGGNVADDVGGGLLGVQGVCSNGAGGTDADDDQAGSVEG